RSQAAPALPRPALSAFRSADRHVRGAATGALVAMALALSARERRCIAWFVIAVVVVRVATLGAYPLMDTTEARYAEIARKMLEPGEWLRPQFDYGLPFWGKPPLSTWLSALAMAILGVNELAARLPSTAVLAACGALVYALAAARGGRDQALWT